MRVIDCHWLVNSELSKSEFFCEGLILYLQDVEDYLNENGAKDVMKEYDDRKTLTELKRHKLVNILVDMLIDRYGLYPKSLEKIMLAKAVIVLFPKFKVEGTLHGTVSGKMAECLARTYSLYNVWDCLPFLGIVLQSIEEHWLVCASYEGS